MSIMVPQEKLQKIRELMFQANLDAYILFDKDPHNSEYLPAHWKAIEWLTEFTGSTATVVITKDFAGLWTDSRYFIQAESQLKNSGFVLVKLQTPHLPEYISWIRKALPENSHIAFDTNLISQTLFEELQKKFKDKRIKLHNEPDLLNHIWTNRPPLPNSKAFLLDFKYSGRSFDEKVKVIRKEMLHNADYLMVSSLDNIAWLLNIRGSDIKYTPVVLAFCIIGIDKVHLFIERYKVADIENYFDDNKIEIHDYKEICDFLKNIQGNNIFMVEKSRINNKLHSLIAENNKIVEVNQLIERLKSKKNQTEIANIKTVMIRDGVAMTKFLIWLDKNVGKTIITENSAAGKLAEFRSQQKDFFDLSFSSISAYNENGAIVHYDTENGNNAELLGKGLYLIDSGGQYFGGTTDITRTIALGTPTDEEKINFTLVLKGHIKLAMSIFPEGTKGYQLDAFARMPLWQKGLNYEHGTGHGVGAFLGVHEGPQRISPAAVNVSLEEGMIISNEPGLYFEGKYGIRIENLILVENASETQFGKFFKFETITLCPIDRKLIKPDMLDKDEIDWLNNYHLEVNKKLSPYLDEFERKWLKEKTGYLSFEI